MSDSVALPSPETVERQFRLLALILLLMAIGLIFKATTLVVTDVQAQTYLRFAQKGIGILTLIPILVFAVWKIQLLRKVPKHLRSYLNEPESFACEVWKKAVLYSWAGTLFFLYLIPKLSEKLGGSTEFYVRLTMAVMLAGFSLSFFYLYRTDDTEDVFEGVTE